MVKKLLPSTSQRIKKNLKIFCYARSNLHSNECPNLINPHHKNHHNNHSRQPSQICKIATTSIETHSPIMLSNSSQTRQSGAPDPEKATFFKSTAHPNYRVALTTRDNLLPLCPSLSGQTHLPKINFVICFLKLARSTDLYDPETRIYSFIATNCCVISNWVQNKTKQNRKF